VSSSDRISPTAHYTGWVWARNGLSHPELETLEGRAMYESVRPAMAVSGALGRDTLEAYLLARHRAIDFLLEQAIEAGTVSQVLEVACGLSPRGWRFSQKHGEHLTYVEADLPGMAGRKRAALEKMNSLTDHHRVVEIDALRDDGPDSLASVGEALDPERGVAIITEGLLGYLDTDSVMGVWNRFAALLHGFPSGLYMSDLHLGVDTSPEIRAFRLMLSGFVRGGVHLHFQDAEEAVAALRAAGFDAASLTPAADIGGRQEKRGGHRVHIIEASTTRPKST
jgi:O-methyltransferase involved in polyketide biosynthesis